MAAVTGHPLNRSIQPRPFPLSPAMPHTGDLFLSPSLFGRSGKNLSPPLRFRTVSVPPGTHALCFALFRRPSKHAAKSYQRRRSNLGHTGFTHPKSETDLFQGE